MVKINSSQSTPDYIQIGATANITGINSDRDVAFNTTQRSSGAKLTRSGSSVVVGQGVSAVRVSYSAMAEAASTAGYLFTRVRLNGTDVSQGIDGSTNQFKSTSESKVIDVASGNTISLRVDPGGGSLSLRAGSAGVYLLVEVIK